MFGLRRTGHLDELLTSRLLNQENFYKTFTKDLMRAKHEVVIESPFLSSKRLNYLLPIFDRLTRDKLLVIVNTKHPAEHGADHQLQAEWCITRLQEVGANVLFTGGHHRKLAIIDRQILYEGSLNILSQNDSCEIMRRIYSERLAIQMIDFIGVSKFIG